jgi:hypothetical protein
LSVHGADVSDGQPPAYDTSRLELTGEPVTVAEQVGSYREYGFFSASTNGVLAYRIGSGSGALRLTWFDREGKVLRTLGTGVFTVLWLFPRTEDVPLSADAIPKPESTRSGCTRKVLEYGQVLRWPSSVSYSSCCCSHPLHYRVNDTGDPTHWPRALNFFCRLRFRMRATTFAYRT